MNYDQWKTTEPIDYPSADEELDERAGELHRAEMDALAMMRKLHDDEAGFLERTPAEIANDLESYRADCAAGEGWDDALQGLADTIAFAVAWGTWINEWMLALKAAIGEDYEKANGLLGWISRQMTEMSDYADRWEDRAHDKIGGR